MKKILFILCLFFCVASFGQTKGGYTSEVIVPAATTLDNWVGFNIKGTIGGTLSWSADYKGGQFSGISTKSWFLHNNGDASNSYHRAAFYIGDSSLTPSALLNVSSTTKGFLPPRMSAAQRVAITSPATGLIVFDLDSLSTFQYNGSGWQNLYNTGGSSSRFGVSGEDATATQARNFQLNGNTFQIENLNSTGQTFRFRQRSTTNQSSLTLSPTAAEMIAVDRPDEYQDARVTSKISSGQPIAELWAQNTLAGTYNRLTLNDDSASLFTEGSDINFNIRPLPLTDTTLNVIGITANGRLVRTTKSSIGGGSGANTALSNLASVEVNTSLISDANNTDDLGSTSLAWKDIYSYTHKLKGATSGEGTLQAAAIAGTNTWTLPAVTGTVVLREGAETITGAKTFSAVVAATSGINTQSTATSSNLSSPTGSTVSNTTLSTFQIGGATTTHYRVSVGGGTNPQMLANTSNASFIAASVPSLEGTSGTHPINARFAILPQSIDDAAGSTTDATTLLIWGEPTGTATITNPKTSLWVQSGRSKFGGVIQVKGYTVATLPTGVQGDIAYVTDALAPTYLGTIAGGGSVVTPVFFDGTNWIAH